MSKDDDSDDGIDRRDAIRQVGGMAAVAVLGLNACNENTRTDKPATPEPSKPASRMPVAYVPHGGGPWPFVKMNFGKQAEWDRLATYLRDLRGLPPAPPKAIVVISAHWEEAVPTIMMGDTPPLYFDYSGFPEAAYQLTWPAPGSPDVGRRVASLLSAAGIEHAVNTTRGFDHGTFVPLKVTYPEAAIPTLQISLVRGLDPATHLALGRALAPLRDEGVFIVGSGMSYHNMRGFGPAGHDHSVAFDVWLGQTVALPASERSARLVDWASGPSARQCHPREEHLIPLLVVAGAALEDEGTVGYQDDLMSVRVSGYHFG